VARQVDARRTKLRSLYRRLRRSLALSLCKMWRVFRRELAPPLTRGLRYAGEAAAAGGSALSRYASRVSDRVRRRPDWKAVTYVLGIAAGFLFLTVLLELPHGPEHWSADLRTAYLSPRPQKQDARIALIYITDKTLERFHYISPIDRQFLADLIKAVDAAGPRAIGLDFIFSRPTEAAKDQAILDAIRGAHAAVVLGAIQEPLTPKDRAYQADFLAKAKRVVGHLYVDAHHDALVLSDHVVRFMADRGNSAYPKSLAEVLAEAAGVHIAHKTHYISWLLPPKNGTETFLSLSAEHVLGLEGEPLPLKALLADKIVLIGTDSFDRDQHLIPLSVIKQTRYPGLFIHAQILAQFLDNRSLNTLTWPQQLLLLVVAAALGFWVGRKPRQIHLVTEFISVAALIVAGILAFVLYSLIFPYTGVLLAWLAGFTAGHHSRQVHA
jgi:adenylate cyclase